MLHIMANSYVDDDQSLSYFFPREHSGQAIDKKIGKKSSLNMTSNN